MADTAYLSLKGQTSGAVKGGVTQKGRENTIEVIAASQQITVPYDVATGQASGKRQHKPFKVTKRWDQSTPILLKMLTTNETITQWKLDFFAPNAAGVEKNNYRVELVNARLISYDFSQPDLTDPASSKRGLTEQLSFVYQKITWSCLDPTDVSSSDDWGAAL